MLEAEISAWLEVLNAERRGTLSLPPLKRDTLAPVAGLKTPADAQALLAWLKTEVKFIRGLREPQTR
jgi:hypothetical protein